MILLLVLLWGLEAAAAVLLYRRAMHTTRFFKPKTLDPEPPPENKSDPCFSPVAVYYTAQRLTASPAEEKPLPTVEVTVPQFRESNVARCGLVVAILALVMPELIALALLALILASALLKKESIADKRMGLATQWLALLALASLFWQVPIFLTL